MCDNWDYEDHENRHLVTKACHDIQVRVSSNFSEIKEVMKLTRPYHHEIFKCVVPDDKEAYAGNYRGSDYPYLKYYNVCIGSHIGEEAARVHQTMQSFHTLLAAAISDFESKTTQFSQKKRVVIYARLISHFVVTFLSIHPYANGNGHISRLIAWALFSYKGFNVINWDLDKRPDRPFDDFIAMYQQGRKEAMVIYFLTLLQQE